MKYLVTGANGQLGRETVLALQAAGEDVTGIGREGVDFSKPGTVAAAIRGYQADWVINCAAYTQVDRAEEEPDLAFCINRDSAGEVAKGVASYGGRLLHVSTDYVFNGEQSHPYREEDTPAPINVYGQSKWEGEQAVQQALPNALILRTAWVYGAHGNNFVKTILRLAQEREELRVVDDQIGTPTWTVDIAKATQTLMNNDASGIYHFTNEGVASWYDFSVEIVSIAKEIGLPTKVERIVPISTKEYPTAARRANCAVLSKEKIRCKLAYQVPHWEVSLRVYMRLLNSKE